MDKRGGAETVMDTAPPPDYDEGAAYGSSASTHTSYPPPPQQGAHTQGVGQQRGAEVVRIPPVNPGRVSSGFTQAVPGRLAQVSRRAIDPETWTRFIRELNAVVARVPSTLVSGAADFWLVSLVTLGMSRQGCDRYEAHVFNRAMALVECYNRAEFAAWGITVRLRVVPPPDWSSVHSDGSHHVRPRPSLELTAEQS
ncbi:hypothetical protein H4R21_000507 [Coemansia helicoidea]|uniref:Uncharacterized protein n=1 Tax=Coemansia helicoidea TaxID=1286919 RepID=A0ACC1LFY3_9FUNG|nr:hypothetical protein H4R21_000507 [Coemansia helicoidea]